MYIDGGWKMGGWSLCFVNTPKMGEVGWVAISVVPGDSKEFGAFWS